LKRVAASAHHAKLYLDACKMHDFGPFDSAFSNEGMARALLSNDPDAATMHLVEARKIGENIKKDEDREWLHTNLDEISAMMHGT